MMDWVLKKPQGNTLLSYRDVLKLMLSMPDINVRLQYMARLQSQLTDHDVLSFCGHRVLKQDARIWFLTKMQSTNGENWCKDVSSLQWLNMFVNNPQATGFFQEATKEDGQFKKQVGILRVNLADCVLKNLDCLACQNMKQLLPALRCTLFSVWDWKDESRYSRVARLVVCSGENKPLTNLWAKIKRHFRARFKHYKNMGDIVGLCDNFLETSQLNQYRFSKVVRNGPDSSKAFEVFKLMTCCFLDETAMLQNIVLGQCNTEKFPHLNDLQESWQALLQKSLLQYTRNAETYSNGSTGRKIDDALVVWLVHSESNTCVREPDVSQILEKARAAQCRGEQLGDSHSFLEFALSYTRLRRQFGDPATWNRVQWQNALIQKVCDGPWRRDELCEQQFNDILYCMCVELHLKRPKKLVTSKFSPYSVLSEIATDFSGDSEMTKTLEVLAESARYVEENKTDIQGVFTILVELRTRKLADTNLGGALLDVLFVDGEAFAKFVRAVYPAFRAAVKHKPAANEECIEDGLCFFFSKKESELAEFALFCFAFSWEESSLGASLGPPEVRWRILRVIQELFREPTNIPSSVISHLQIPQERPEPLCGSRVRQVDRSHPVKSSLGGGMCALAECKQGLGDAIRARKQDGHGAAFAPHEYVFWRDWIGLCLDCGIEMEDTQESIENDTDSNYSLWGPLDGFYKICEALERYENHGLGVKSKGVWRFICFHSKSGGKELDRNPFREHGGAFLDFAQWYLHERHSIMTCDHEAEALVWLHQTIGSLSVRHKRKDEEIKENAPIPIGAHVSMIEKLNPCYPGGANFVLLWKPLDVSDKPLETTSGTLKHVVKELVKLLGPVHRVYHQVYLNHVFHAVDAFAPPCGMEESWYSGTYKNGVFAGERVSAAKTENLAGIGVTCEQTRGDEKELHCSWDREVANSLVNPSLASQDTKFQDCLSGKDGRDERGAMVGSIWLLKEEKVTEQEIQWDGHRYLQIMSWDGDGVTGWVKKLVELETSNFETHVGTFRHNAATGATYYLELEQSGLQNVRRNRLGTMVSRV